MEKMLRATGSSYACVVFPWASCAARKPKNYPSLKIYLKLTTFEVDCLIGEFA